MSVIRIADVRNVRSGRFGQAVPATAPKTESGADPWALIWRHRRRLAVGLVLIGVTRLAGLALPAISKYVLDDVVGQQHWDLLPLLMLAAATAVATAAVASFMTSQILSMAAERTIIDLRRRLDQHVLRLPTRFFDSTTAGALTCRILTDAEGVRHLMGTGFVHMGSSLVTAITAFVILLYLNPWLTLVSALVFAALGSSITVTLKRLRPLLRERNRLVAEVTGRLAESLGAVRIVKAYAAEKREALVFTRGAHRLFRILAKARTGRSVVGACSTVVVGITAIAMTWSGVLAIRHGGMTPGDLLMYLSLVALITTPVVSLASAGTQITEALAGLDRIREILELPCEDQDDWRRAPLAHVRGEVEFEDVSFAYTPGVPVLKHVSFRAPAGSTTALVGPSGSGKTTLGHLVLGFIRPESGRVLVDGCDLESVKLRDYRSHLGVVLQESTLLDGTIAENIRLGNPHATDDEVKEVGRLSHCAAFVESFERGYDTVIGERGVRLSGGQRQRIAIARAIIAEPRILVLDEATSNLDTENEALVQDGLQSLLQGRTTFVIAHRLSTIRTADQILVLEAGAIVERGTHDSLLARRGRYWQLYGKPGTGESGVDALRSVS